VIPFLGSCLEPSLGEGADREPLGVERLSLGDLEPSSPPVVACDLEVRVRFNDLVDPESLSEGTAMVVAGAALGACEGQEGCPGGLCVEGGCFGAPVDEAFRKDANRPPLTASRSKQVIPAHVWLTADGRELRLKPWEALAPRSRYALLLSAAITDRSGNPLVSKDGQTQGLLYEFVTGVLGGPRPSIRMLSPQGGAEGVPSNIAEALVSVTGAVEGVGEDGLWLVGPRGRVPGRVVQFSAGCPAQYASCHQIVLGGALEPLTAYRIGLHERLRDAEGRPLPSESEELFTTGIAPDLEPPEVTDLSVEADGGCLEVRLVADEPAKARLRWWSGLGPGELTLVGLQTEHRGAIPLFPLPETLSVDLWDAVGNLGGRGSEELVIEPLPPVAISEVLANPAGPEPAQEFVELVNLGSVPVSLEGWWITDSLAKEGDALPAEELPRGAVGLVVPSTYQPDGVKDPLPAPGSILLRLSGSTIGSSGLANAGEPVFLKDSEGRVVSRYPGAPSDGSLPSNGQSVGRELGAWCSERGPWRLNPAGSSTPGVLE
jgi:hypothetical protein